MLMLNVGYARHDADWNFTNVSSPFTRIYYVTKGEAMVVTGSETIRLTPGNMYMIPAFTEHTDICTGVFEHYYVHILEDGSWNENITGSYSFPFEIKGTSLDEELFRNLCNHNMEMALKYSDPKIYDNKHSMIECVRLNRSRPLFDRLESMGIIFQLMGRFVRFATPKIQVSDARIARSIEIITMKMDEMISIEQLSEQACMSNDHFIRLFRQEIGMTPMQFIIGNKMTRAKLMLASENMTVKAVAYSLGYSDVSYFTRIFNRHTGMTPRQYRQRFNAGSGNVLPGSGG